MNRRPGSRLILSAVAAALLASAAVVELRTEEVGSESIAPAPRERVSAQPGLRILAAEGTVQGAAYRERAIALYERGELHAALEALRSARQIDPSDVWACQMEARVALDLGDTAAYCEALRGVLAASPDSAELQNTVGQLLMDAGETQAGLLGLERAAALEPENAEYAKSLAAACLKAKLPACAQYALKRAWRVNPEMPAGLAGLAAVYESQRDWSAALETYDALLSLQPGKAEWASGRLRCLQRLGLGRREFAEGGDSEGLDGPVIVVGGSDEAAAVVRADEVVPAEEVEEVVPAGGEEDEGGPLLLAAENSVDNSVEELAEFEPAEAEGPELRGAENSADCGVEKPAVFQRPLEWKAMPAKSEREEGCLPSDGWRAVGQ